MALGLVLAYHQSTGFVGLLPGQNLQIIALYFLSVTLFDLKQKLEDERRVWEEEREQLIKQTQKLPEEFSGINSINRLLYSVHLHPSNFILLS